VNIRIKNLQTRAEKSFALEELPSLLQGRTLLD
jgi:hypothetical protein